MAAKSCTSADAMQRGIERRPGSAPSSRPGAACAKYGPCAASALAVLALCSLLFGVMAVLAKAAALRLPGPQVAFVRFLFGLAACALVSVRRPMRARNLAGLVWRGVFGGAAVLCYFLCIEHLPVGIATLI